MPDMSEPVPDDALTPRTSPPDVVEEAGHGDELGDGGLGNADADHRRAIEAIVLVSRDPVPPELLAQLLERSVTDVERWCQELAAEYEAERRGFQLVRVAGGYRYQTHPDLTPYVERYLLHDQRARLSSAALETLAIIAYKQPISRAQIASIRGVNADGVMRTLEARGYVQEVGRDPGPGNAIMYGTTPLFLEKLGLDSLDQLPPLGAFVPGADVVEQLERTLRVEPSSGGEAGDHSAAPGAAGVAPELSPNGNGAAPTTPAPHLGGAPEPGGEPEVSGERELGGPPGFGTAAGFGTAPEPEGEPDATDSP